MLNRASASTIPCGRPFFRFLHLLRSMFSSTLETSVGQEVLDDSTKFAVLCNVVEFMCRTLQTGRQKRFL